MKQNAPRIGLVTGASRGFGAEIAQALAKEGVHVIAVARRQSGLEMLDDKIKKSGGQASLVVLDLADLAGIDHLAETIYQRWRKLDILIANGAMLGPLSLLSHIAPEDWQKVMEVNLFANWRLIRACDPLLRQSDHGRVVFVTSAMAQIHRPFWGLYGTTKAALEYLARTYAAECQNTKIRVNLVDPGMMRTKMRAEAMPGEDPADLPWPGQIVPLCTELSSPDCDKNGQIIRFQTTSAPPSWDGQG